MGYKMERESLILSHEVITFRSPFDQHTRLDKCMVRQFPAYSRTFLQDIIAKQQVIINGAKIGKASTIIAPEDTLEVTFEQPQQENKINHGSHDFGITILAQTEHYIIINKPAGLIVHASDTQQQVPTLVDWITHNFDDIKQVGVIDRPGIVHRLDKDTSGVMIIARTNYAQQNFTQQFKDRTISKTYLALVEGHTDQQGVINAPIGRHPVKRHKMATFSIADQIRSSDIRPSVTQYTVLEYFKDTALVELKPVTGRTHQIRVHMASIGHPLVGDQVYGKASKIIMRHALHASSLSFQFDGTPVAYHAPLADDFQQVVSFLRSA